MEQGTAATAVLERPADSDADSNVHVQLRTAIERELASDARDARPDVDGGMFSEGIQGPKLTGR